MRAILDTHAFLWWLLDDPRLSPAARAFLGDPGSEPLLSVASAWEIAIKLRLGRLQLEGDLFGFLSRQLRVQGIDVLAIELAHACAVAELPLHHLDPFDRLLVAQAGVESLPIVTGDPAFAAYGVDVVW